MTIKPLTQTIPKISIRVSDTILSWIFGIGLFSFILHNEKFVLHNSEGENVIFLPQWGFILSMAIVIFLWKENRLTKEALGKKIIYIPLLIIVTFICLRIFPENFSKESFVEAIFAIGLFSFYITSRILGKQIFYPLIIFNILNSAYAIIYSLFLTTENSHSYLAQGGLLSETNYDAAAGFTIICTFLAMFIIQNKLHKVFYLSLSIIGLLFMGAPEGVVAITILVIFMLLRKDISKYSLIPITIVILPIIIWFAIGYGTTQHSKTFRVVEDAIHGEIGTDVTGHGWGEGRLPAYKRALGHINLIGYEYDIYDYGKERTEEQGLTYTNVNQNVIVHNVPLVIVEQIGIIPALAWLFISIYCFVKTKFKYIWMAVASVCLFDHYIWTTMAPYWWVIVGITTSTIISNDYIFKGNKDVKENQTINI